MFSACEACCCLEAVIQEALAQCYSLLHGQVLSAPLSNICCAYKSYWLALAV